MDKPIILWADDEIDLLKPHILFLEQKGYEVVTANSGADAIDLVRERSFDIVFLDEQMPGVSGIEALEVIKREFPNLPVVMITKSEEETIMESAIGSDIADYLIKPVNPNQILLSLKRNLENRKLRDEKSTLSYQQEFRSIAMELGNNLNYDEWIASTRNWCVGNWSCRSRAMRASSRFWPTRNRRRTPSSPDLWSAIISTGSKARPTNP